ncbi:MAG: hypothetical protein Q8M09_11785 [Pseudomonadota bacterium]|nr:hypothetical protein [Pseudomonadota bacterium]MDP1904910.1 hypothetical protein [Pseudomonadota bacterium]MDP2352033.1 hypothetical protein [Pseudomonadota bacterium]
MADGYFSILSCFRQSNAASAHMPNPDHPADPVEPRANVLASCAGHGGDGCVMYWPHYAFRIDSLESMREMSERLHDNQALVYRWGLVGHFMPRFGFCLGFALSIHDRQKLDAVRVDADFSRLVKSLLGETSNPHGENNG